MPQLLELRAYISAKSFFNSHKIMVVKWILFITKSTITHKPKKKKWRRWSAVKGDDFKYLYMIWNFHQTNRYAQVSVATAKAKDKLHLVAKRWRGNLRLNQMKHQHYAVPAPDISFQCAVSMWKSRATVAMVTVAVTASVADTFSSLQQMISF